MYDVNYFIDFFSKIPEERIVVGRLDDGDGGKCINGWLGTTKIDEPSEASRGLYELFKDVEVKGGTWTYKDAVAGYSDKAAAINNGYTDYNQPTPKQRIIAALEDIKKMQVPA